MWPRRKLPRGNPAVEATSPGIGAECEAFVTGRYVEHLAAHQIPVPAWTWLNLLAHGTMEDLRLDDSRLTARDHRSPNDAELWRAARSYLSGEILELVESSNTSLRRIQAATIRPTESRACQAQQHAPWTADRMVTEVLSGLSQQRHLHR